MKYIVTNSAQIHMAFAYKPPVLQMVLSNSGSQAKEIPIRASLAPQVPFKQISQIVSPLFVKTLLPQAKKDS